MTGILAAQRYAKALMSLAIEKDQLDRVSADLRSVHLTIADSKDLRVVLRSPVIKNEQKLSSLKAIFSEASEDTIRLFDVLAANNRIDLLAQITLAFVKQVDQMKGVTTANVTTAVPISEEMEQKILLKIKEITASNEVVLTKAVDKKLLGGFLLRFDDLEYDASISGKFNSLQHLFKQNAYA